MKIPSFSVIAWPSLPRFIQFSTTLGALVVGSTAQAVDYIKANNENNLNTNGSWLDSSGNPATSFSPNSTTSTDLWTWDNRVTNANSGGDGVNNVHASDQGVKTVRILDPEVAVAISLDTATAGRTMTYTAGGGIDMANATQDLTFVNGFYRATGGVAASYNVKTGRKLEFLSAAAQNVRGTNVGGGTVSMNTDGVSAGRIVIGGVFNPSNVIIGAGLVEFNSPSGTTRNGTSSTVVNGGKLVVNNTSGSATGSGSVTIKNTATLTGQGIMTGLVTVESGGTLIPGNGVGSLKAGSLTLAAGSTIEWEGVDPLNSDLISVTAANGLTINGGTLKLYNSGTTDPFTGTGVFNIFEYASGSSIPNTSNLTIAESSKISGQSYFFGVTGTFVTLTIGPDTRPKAFWNVDADGAWPTGSNWTGGVAPNAATSIANLGGAQGAPITAPRTVTLDSDSTVGTLNFDSAQPFTLTGTGTLTFDIGGGPGTLHVENGSHVISTPLSVPDDGLLASVKNLGSTLTLQGDIQGFGGLSKSDAGTLILAADNSYVGTTSIGAGVLQLGAGGTTGSVSSGGILNNGTLRINRSDNFDFEKGITGSGGMDFGGTGTTKVTADNTFSGPTTISAGAVILARSLALQNSTLNYSTTGGALTIWEDIVSVTLGGLAGDRSFPLTNALGNPVALTVGQNNASTSYTASSVDTGTSFTKVGTGTLSLSGTHQFPTTTINAGVLKLDSGADFTAAPISFAVGTAVGTSKLVINGGALHSSGTTLVPNSSLGIEISAGSASFDGGLTSDNNSDFGAFNVRATGGTLDIASVSYGRGNLNFGPNPNPVEPTAGSTSAGLYVNGGTVNISGALSIGKSASNSSVSARVDSGSLTVGGATTVAINSPDRWSALDIFGGTFTSTDVTTGVRLGGTTAGQVVMLVRGGVATAERFQFGQPDLSGSAILNQTAGSLYVGAGGMVLGSANPALIARLKLGGGVLGATADSTSTVPVSLTGAAVVTGADSLDTPHTVSFSGSVTGTGSLTKNGSGSVSFTSPNNSFSGAITVSTGTLGLGGQTGAVSVASGSTLVPYGTHNPQAASTVNGTLGIRYDVDNGLQPGRIHSQGTLTLGASSVLNISGTGTLTAPVYFLASGASGISGTFGSFTGTVPPGYTLNSSFNNGSGFPVIALVSNTASPYDLWAAGLGLSGAAAGANADPDNDGVQNLVEFGQGSNPTQFSAGPVLGSSGNFLTLTFNHIAGSNLVFAIEASDNLGTWTTVHTYPTFGSAGSTIYTDNVATGSTDHRFLRLTVNLAN